MSDDFEKSPRPADDEPTVQRPKGDPAALLGLGFGPNSDLESTDWQPPDAGWLDGQLDRYQVRRLLGRGGMGAVYLAWQKSLDRDVAIKLLAPTLASSTIQRERFVREGRVLAHLNHPHIVNVHDFGELDDGTMYLVMEHVDGGNLFGLIVDGPCDCAAAVEKVIQLCDAVQTAHDAGVIHRDIKPGNILLTRAGRIKLADFGLVRPTGPFAEQLRLTMTGTTVGTLDYIAPELFEGADPDDPRRDVYSIGVVLYELLTGRRPRGSFAPPSKTQGVPSAMDAIVRKALHPDDTHRYASAAALAEALKKTRPATGVRRVLPWAGVTAVVIVALFAAVWVINAVLFSQNENPDLGPTTVITPEGTTQARDAPGPSVSTPVESDATPTSPPDPTASVDASTIDPSPALPPERIPAADEAGWVSLLPAVELDRDRMAGTWTRTADGVRSGSDRAVLRLPADPNGSYDVRLRFTKHGGENSIALFLTHPAGSGHAELDAWGQNLAGVQNIDGRSLQERADRFSLRMRSGQTYDLLVAVRPDRITMTIDGGDSHTTDLRGRTLSIHPIWEMDTPPALGIATWETPVTLHAVEYRPIGR